MTHTNNNRGRTFWDLIAEHPKMTFTVIVILVLAILFLAINKYSIKSPVLSIEPDKPLPTVTNSVRDTIKSSKPNTFDTSVTIKRHLVSNPKTRSHQEQLVIKQPKIDTIRTEAVNVTSNNQSGGITANQVNIGAAPRKLDFSIQNQLLSFLQNKNEKITITSILGDPESFQFANQINDLLKAQGFTKVDGVGQAVFIKPVIGQFIDRDTSGVKILIGSKPNP